MNHNKAQALSMIGAFAGPEALEMALPKKRERQFKQCVLPECEKMTTHNGGYCCAEHCKEHRRRQKA